MSRTRFSSKPPIFVGQIKILDNLQLSSGTPPHALKYQDWFWTDEESAEVTKIRQKAEELFAIMENKRNCPPEIRVEMRILIKNFMAYDHGKVEPHNLLNKIAMFGGLTDWEATNVKRGTPLAKTPSKPGSGISTLEGKPVVLLRRLGVKEHLLVVKNADTPESRTTPPGYSSTNMYCFIGTEPPARLNQYEYVGKTKRSLFLKNFNNIEPLEDKRIYAWYIARYMSSTGVLSSASDPLKVEIILSVS